MSSILKKLDEGRLKKLILQVLSWRLGDSPSLVPDLAQEFSIELSDSISLLELICPILDYAINNNPETAECITKSVKVQVGEELIQKLAENVWATKEKSTGFCLEHTPSLSRVLYHDYVLETQIATESLGRIARPIASITLRIQPASTGKLLLPPLESVSMELTKDVIDALNNGFDRLKTQLNKIVQSS